MKIDEIVRTMHPPRYTEGQAAKMVGRSKDTLRRWRREQKSKASDKRQFGSVTVPLYTDGDIEGLKVLARQTKPGRPSES